MFKSISLLMAGLWLAGTACIAQTAPSNHAPLPLRALAAGTCVNMGNHLEAPNEGDWGRPISKSDFTIIARAGFETVRLPVRWSAHAALGAPYTIDPIFMDRVQLVVSQARKAGLKIIINDHNYDDLMVHPAQNSARLAGIWKQVAATFADAPRDRVWFEIENEPHDRLDNANLLATLLPALSAIRQTNPDRTVIIGGENWSGIDSLATLHLPDDPHVVPTFHYYLPFAFTHQGAAWVTPMPPLGRIYGSDADRALLAGDVAKVIAYMQRTHMAPFLGEFGSTDTAPLDQRVAYQTAVRKAFDPLHLGMCAWAYANTFPLYDNTSHHWLAGMRSAMGLPE